VQTIIQQFPDIKGLISGNDTMALGAYAWSSPEQSLNVTAINVRGVFVVTQAALKHMKSGDRIIMIGSCAGERLLISGRRPTLQPEEPSRCLRKVWRVSSERAALWSTCPAGGRSI
jgi:NAD(P)-dependent dehydrogenase (short-subunit alcohol dehydrogenase family)